ncbi:MAG: 50S ribosomal protein L9 [Xanthobacteraceae bacterium]|nr:50S ribosomal protein L9 [Xanthobacteraceae bacterium]
MTASLKVLLVEPVPHRGKIGDVIQVKPGFARNYLFPRMLAVYATADNVRKLDVERARHEERAKLRRQQAELDREAIAQQFFTFIANELDGNTIYGSFTAKRIAKQIAQRGIDVRSEQVGLPGPITTFGSHRVVINLFDDIVAEIEVHVVRSAADAEEFARMALHARQDRAIALLESVASKTTVATDETAHLAEIAALTGEEIGAATAKAVAKKSLPELQTCVSRLLEELNVNCLASFTCAADETDAAILKAKMTVFGALSVDVGTPATVRVADLKWLQMCEPRLSLFSPNARLAGPAKQYDVKANDGTLQAVVVEQNLRRTSKDKNSDAHTEIWASAFVNGTCVQRGVWTVD